MQNAMSHHPLSVSACDLLTGLGSSSLQSMNVSKGDVALPLEGDMTLCETIIIRAAYPHRAFLFYPSDGQRRQSHRLLTPWREVMLSAWQSDKRVICQYANEILYASVPSSCIHIGETCLPMFSMMVHVI